MSKFLSLGLALPLLAACAAVEPSSAAPAAEPATANVCRKDGLAAFAGRPATAELGTEVLRASGARTLQWVEAGTMVTMDFREDRVRVWLDEQNRVARVNCG